MTSPNTPQTQGDENGSESSNSRSQSELQQASVTTNDRDCPNRGGATPSTEEDRVVFRLENSVTRNSTLRAAMMAVQEGSDNSSTDYILRSELHDDDIDEVDAYHELEEEDEDEEDEEDEEGENETEDRVVDEDEDGARVGVDPELEAELAACTEPALVAEHPLGHLTKLRTSLGSELAKFCKCNAATNSRANVFSMLMGRQQNSTASGCFSAADRCHLSQRFLPTHSSSVVDSMHSRAYVGQFSNDGSLFVGAYQDRRILIYDVYRGWTIHKDILARNLRWTITDTALSPDQRFLVYASITPIVHMVNVGGDAGIKSVANVNDIHEALDFSMTTGRRGMDRDFGLWSLQFSADGREIVAGSSDHALYIYDVEASKSLFRVPAHEDDVNAVAFADVSSNLIFSGSDDYLCKVWDRRQLRGHKSKPAGILTGHLEGITHIDSKGDGFHFISNSKDQTMKLWDTRRMCNYEEYKKLPPVRLPHYRWDYRWMDYPGQERKLKHPRDQSLQTYRGHVVLQTLIRCYFSPTHSTGQQYLYTGSHDGAVYIYDMLTGDRLERLKFHRATVRDCSWHPSLPMLASVSWDGQLAKWEYPESNSRPRWQHPKPPRFSIEQHFFDLLDSD